MLSNIDDTCCPTVQFLKIKTDNALNYAKELIRRLSSMCNKQLIKNLPLKGKHF